MAEPVLTKFRMKNPLVEVVQIYSNEVTGLPGAGAPHGQNSKNNLHFFL